MNSFSPLEQEGEVKLEILNDSRWVNEGFLYLPVRLIMENRKVNVTLIQ